LPRSAEPGSGRLYGGAAEPRLPLFCPPGVLDRLAGLEPDADLTAVFDLHPLPGTYRAGPFELTGVPLPHFVPNAGIRVQAAPAEFHGTVLEATEGLTVALQR
jgi:hypothetical protein